MFYRSTSPRILGAGIDRLALTITPQKMIPLSWRESLLESFVHEVGRYTVAATNNVKLDLADKRELADFLLIDTGRFTDPRSGPVYRFSACAATCARLSPRMLLEVCRRSVSALLGRYSPETQVSYLELYVDFQGVPRPDLKLFRANTVTRAKSLSIKEDEGKPTALHPNRRSLLIGSKSGGSTSVYASFYEKSLTDGTDWRRAFYEGKPGYDPGDTITRLEFRIPTARTLSKLKCNPDLSALLGGGLNSLWTYLTTRWLRVLLPNEKAKARARIHPAWKEVSLLLPIPDGPESVRDFVVPVNWNGFERAVAVGGGALRSCAGLPETAYFKCLAQAAFLDAVKMLMAGELPISDEELVELQAASIENVADPA